MQLYEDLLAIERGWWTIASNKNAAIRERTGLTPMQYYIHLSFALDSDAFEINATASAREFEITFIFGLRRPLVAGII